MLKFNPTHYFKLLASALYLLAQGERESAFKKLREAFFLSQHEVRCYNPDIVAVTMHYYAGILYNRYIPFDYKAVDIYNPICAIEHQSQVDKKSTYNRTQVLRIKIYFTAYFHFLNKNYDKALKFAKASLWYNSPKKKYRNSTELTRSIYQHSRILLYLINSEKRAYSLAALPPAA